MNPNTMTGHTFLASLGKTHLRPGGKKATEWLLEQAHITASSRVLEVACNMGTTATRLAKTTGCRIDAVDLDQQVLQQAQKKIQAEGVSNLIHLHHANALNLPFDNNTFDVVINEAMLTMVPPTMKPLCVAEYFRVLKPGGVLLTHDVMLTATPSMETQKEFDQALHLHVTPLSKNDWITLMRNGGAATIDCITGRMSVLSLDGILHDEGWQGMMTILTNAMKTENITRFRKMYHAFNDEHNGLAFIALASHKPA